MENDVSYRFIQSYLTNGEYVLWRGKPGKGHLLNKSDIASLPFSLIWCSIVGFAMYNMFREGIRLEVLMFLPFMVAGFHLLVGRFLYAAWLRKRTYYVITNLKVIRWQNKKVDMLMGSNLPPVSVETYKDGNGTIRIGNASPSYRRGKVIYSSTQKDGITLENIPDVARVQQYLTQIASK